MGHEDRRFLVSAAANAASNHSGLLSAVLSSFGPSHDTANLSSVCKGVTNTEGNSWVRMVLRWQLPHVSAFPEQRMALGAHSGILPDHRVLVRLSRLPSSAPVLRPRPAHTDAPRGDLSQPLPPAPRLQILLW